MKQTILIVDDEPQNISIVGELLREDYFIKAATNGEKALEIANSDNPPDLILLDVVMPGINGYEVCKKLKAEEYTKNIPVIFITGKSNEQDEVKGFELGAVDYITKPFSPVIVRVRVKTHAELKKYRDLLENSSTIDGLTSIANRRKFDDYYDVSWKLATRNEKTLSVVMIDIDHFKLFNDNYGHPEGDYCLQIIAKALSSKVRSMKDLFARYGGEEFVCILPDTDLDAAIEIAESFRLKVMDLKIPHERSKVADIVTISVGVASVMPNSSITPDQLLKAADAALYKSKKNGRNLVSSADVI